MHHTPRTGPQRPPRQPHRQPARLPGPTTTSGSLAPAACSLHHPIVGDLDLPFESFLFTTDLNARLVTYTAERGTPTQEALSLLASWAATTAPELTAVGRPDDEAADAQPPANRGLGTRSDLG